jgi:RNA polymerase sigma factor (sigma-70 family)
MAATRLDGMLGATLHLLQRDPRPDAELLAGFLNDGDQNAFEALLVRHTPAVRAACRGWLRAASDIDDAAQATFLVLVQRARSIRNRTALGRWLYGVAANVARRLRRRQRALRPVPEDLPGRAPAGDADLRDVLAAEVAGLPEKYRLPVQLCYWAGLTTTEAAQRLGWARGTVLTRLAWARDRLRKRLVRRGLAPVAVLAGLAGTAVPAVSATWVRATARAAKDLWAGKSLAEAGLPDSLVSLTEGAVRAMFLDRLKYLALAVLLVVGLVGYGLARWASASDGARTGHNGPAAEARDTAGVPGPRAGKDAVDPPDAKDAPKANDARPGAGGRRREAVIRMPLGVYAKEINVPPYGSGRVTWTYEEERVLGLIEGSVMGVEFEMATEAEISLSSNGTIYGVVNSARLTHLKLPDTKEFEEIKPFVGLWPVVEPLINEVTTDLPFSYQFRIQGDRLTISNFRILLAGPNPLGKLGGLAAAKDGGGKDALAAITYFQALGTAFEGTYTLQDGKDRPAPLKRVPAQKPR